MTRLKRNKSIFILSVTIYLALCLTQSTLSAQEADRGFKPHRAMILSDKVNIRSGGGLNFEVIGQLNKGKEVVVSDEKNGWYMIRLPKEARCFVRKDYIEHGSVKTDSLHVRAGGGVNFNSLGRLKKGESVSIIEQRGDWLRIVPPEDCQGWVKKDFVSLSDNQIGPQALAPAPQPVQQEDKGIEACGIINDLGKVFNRQGTHKLIQGRKIIYYLRSKAFDLNLYIYQEVRLKGRLIDSANSRYPVLDVEEMKLLRL